MGLLTIIRKNRIKEKEMRVLFLGLDNAGKTTVLKRLSGEDVSQVSPTLGFGIKSFSFPSSSGSTYTLNVWDVGGQRTLRPYWRNYFESTDAVVWVVDSADRQRIGDCRQELESLLQEERLAGATLLVLANKQDVTNAMNSDEIREALALPKVTTHRWRIQPCSAYAQSSSTEGKLLLDGISWLVKDVAERIYYSTARGDTSSPSTGTDDDRIQRNTRVRLK